MRRSGRRNGSAALRFLVVFLIGAVAGGLIVFLSIPWMVSREEIRSQAAGVSEEPRPLPAESPLAAEPVGVPPITTTDQVETQPESSAGLAPQPQPATGSGDVAIPVVGITRAELRDHFDDARGGRPHRAIDIAAARGTPVVAAVDGEVLKLFLSKPGGITLYQIADDGTTIYYYAHLEGYAPGIAEGKRLRRGEVLGYVGTTGNAPPGAPHLHFAIERIADRKEWWRGEPVNPYPILMSRGVTYGDASAAPASRR
jgi:peptidoglycan LD-endopeptidase LytH